jgi:hypothetical protein
VISMKLQPEIDQKIRDSFENLLTYLQEVEQEDERGQLYVNTDDFYSLQSRFLFLLQMLLDYRNPQIINTLSEIAKLKPAHEADIGFYADYLKLRGLLTSIKFSYETGILGNLTDIIAANISDDYLVQAEYLLIQNFVLPAAVLIGAVLEDTLRRLCQRNNPPIPLLDTNNKPKMLDALITELKKANLFSEPMAAQLRGYTAIRNAAAHGEDTKFGQQDVEQMLTGVKIFLANYL